MGIRNIVFDMGGVLMRFDTDLFMKRAGISDEDMPLIRNEVFRSVEWVQMDRGVLDEDGAFSKMKERLPERLYAKAHDLVFDWDKPMISVPGMSDLVRELKQKGYGIYLLSNASHRQHEYWPRVAGSEYFDATIISADISLVKPMPEIYKVACEKLGINLNESIFIDDMPQNVEAAIYSGMEAVVFYDDVERLRADLRRAGVDV